jgi:hypothetical protein
MYLGLPLDALNGFDSCTVSLRAVHLSLALPPFRMAEREKKADGSCQWKVTTLADSFSRATRRKSECRHLRLLQFFEKAVG